MQTRTHQLDEVIDECRVVLVGEMHDGGDQRVTVVLAQARHQAKVDERQLALAGVAHGQQIARVRVRMEQTQRQQLRQERLLANGGQARNLGRLALRQLHAVHPLRGQHAARGLLEKHLGDVDVRNEAGQLRAHSICVARLVQEIQLAVHAYGPLVQQRHVVGALLRRQTVHEALVHLCSAAQDVQVLADHAANAGPLHLDRNGRSAGAQHALVHLRQRRRRHGLRRQLREDVADWRTQLSLNRRKRDAAVEPRHRVLQLGQLRHGGGADNIRADGHHLADLDVGGAKRLHGAARVGGQLGIAGGDGGGAARQQRGGYFGQERHGVAEELGPARLVKAQGGAARVSAAPGAEKRPRARKGKCVRVGGRARVRRMARYRPRAREGRCVCVARGVRG